MYVGDNSDFKMNSKCPGGPHQDMQSLVWYQGKEIWCNLPGQRVTIDADISYMIGKDTSITTLHICSFGLMGVKYVRDTEPPTTMTVEDGQDEFFSIDKIYPKQKIGNILDIKLK